MANVRTSSSLHAFMSLESRSTLDTSSRLLGVISVHGQLRPVNARSESLPFESSVSCRGYSRPKSLELSDRWKLAAGNGIVAVEETTSVGSFHPNAFGTHHFDRATLEQY